MFPPSFLQHRDSTRGSTYSSTKNLKENAMGLLLTEPVMLDMPGVSLNLSPFHLLVFGAGQVQNGSLTSRDHLPSMPRALQAVVGLATCPLTGSWEEKELGLVQNHGFQHILLNSIY